MIISKNSYLVLWLNSDADEKFLNKRYKELLNFLNIDEVWSYDNDFTFMDYKKIRTEESIKEAFHNLSNQHRKLYQTFFRFQLVDDKDEKCMLDIISWNYVEWSNKWLELFEKTKKYHYLKNHIVWELLFYENKNKFKDLSFTDVPMTIVDLLHKLLTSEGFWKEFKEIFNIQNEIAIREDMIESFKNEIAQFIAEHFFDISEEIWNSKLYKEFSKKFSISAKELDDNKNVTESIKNIEDTLKSIKDMNLSEELDEIIDGVNEITGEIKKLDKLWLENNPKIIRLKDDFSREIRSMAISLFNEHDDSDNAINFIEEAKKVAHSASIKEKLKQDLIDMNEQSEKTEIFKSIIELSKEWKEYFWSKNYKSAEKIYDKTITLILEELSDKFNLENDKLNLLVSKIESSFNMISLWKTTESVLDNIDNMKKLVNEDWWFSWWEDLNFWWLWWDQRLLLMLLIDSVAYKKMSHMIVNKSSYQSNSSDESKFPWWIIWIIIAIIVAIARNA
jgi:hypothetical protein